MYSVFTQSHATTQIARGEQGHHSSVPMPSLWFLKSISSIALIKEEKVLNIKNLPETTLETLNKKSLPTFYALCENLLQIGLPANKAFLSAFVATWFLRNFSTYNSGI